MVFTMIVPHNTPCVGVSGGPSGGPFGVACNSENNTDSEIIRTLIVGPSFCGKTHLLLNKLRLIRLNDYATNSPPRQFRIITRSPEPGCETRFRFITRRCFARRFSRRNWEDLEVYPGCCVVFDDVLDSNQKSIDPFLTDENTSCVMFFFKSELLRCTKKQKKKQFEYNNFISTNMEKCRTHL